MFSSGFSAATGEDLFSAHTNFKILFELLLFLHVNNVKITTYSVPILSILDVVQR